MDFEYADEADQNDQAYFAHLMREHPFDDEEVKKIAFHLLSGSEDINTHSDLPRQYRKDDISMLRSTRIFKSLSNHLFRIQFLNGDSYVLKLNTDKSYDGEIAIMKEVSEVGVEVAKNYLSDSNGIEINGKYYFSMLQEYVEGTDFQHAVIKQAMSSRNKEIILEDMGERLRKIHSITAVNGVPQTHEYARYFPEALEQLDHQRDALISRGIVEQKDFEYLYEKIDSLRETASMFADSAFGLIHGDFHPKHVILNLEQGRPHIRAIIDWGDAIFSNTFFDFALWDFWCGQDFFTDALISGYGAELFKSPESKVNLELTTIAALIKEIYLYNNKDGYGATVLGLWQRLVKEVEGAT